MRLYELIESESLVKELSYTDSSIHSDLASKGYKFAGEGGDQTTWRDPGGNIVKIFGTQQGQRGLTADHKMFIAWYKYATKHSNNRYMPKFFGWETFEIEHEDLDRNIAPHTYIQYKMEKLREVPNKWLALLDKFGISVEQGRTFKFLIKTVKDRLGMQFNDPFVQSIFKDDILWNTVTDLKAVAESNGWGLDLHASNYMMRGPQLIVVDPWVASS